jgi:nitrogen fixation protein FixH
MRLARLWPVAVAAVLGVTIAVNGLLFWAARDRNAAAVEPDYYRKALRWDSTRAEDRTGAALGWRIEADLGALDPAGATLAVRLADRAGAPLEGAAVEVTAVHNLEALHPVVGRLVPVGPGAYGARLPLRRAGLWELRLEVARGGDRLRVSLRRDAAPRGRP